MTETLQLDVQIACAVDSLPETGEMHRWVEAAIASSREPWRVRCEVAVRVVDEQESRELNRRYRQQDRATNVLAFPAGDPVTAGAPEQDGCVLGDLAICGPIVEREAREQGKAAAAHWGHLLVHGTLHLLGYDHQDEAQAAVMERLERRILAGRGVADPYADTGTDPSAAH